jgi:hypothetical protein
VQQEHRLAGAADRVVDLYAVDLGLAVCEPDSGVVSEVHLGELLFLFGRVGADRVADLPERHFCILILSVLTRWVGVHGRHGSFARYNRASVAADVACVAPVTDGVHLILIAMTTEFALDPDGER